jgi:hypothetical protein
MGVQHFDGLLPAPSIISSARVSLHILITNLLSLSITHFLATGSVNLSFATPFFDVIFCSPRTKMYALDLILKIFSRVVLLSSLHPIFFGV